MTQRTVRAILIDPIEKKISEIQLEDDSRDARVGLHAFHRAMDCDCITLAYQTIDGNRHKLYCDDDGLYKAKGMFQIHQDQPLPNKSVLVLESPSGEYHIDAELTIEEVEKAVSWIPDFLIPSVVDSLLGMCKVVSLDDYLQPTEI